MLKIVTAKRELFIDSTSEFIALPSVELQLEHSLISVRKWESKWNKSFLNNKNPTDDEFSDYIRCMTIGKEASPIIYKYLDYKTRNKIKDYINSPMTATTFTDNSSRSYKKDTVTAEIIYYWMIECGIPFECEKWHLNTLLALIKVCHIKQSSGKKMPMNEIYRHNSELNNARRKAIGTKG